MKNTIHKGVEYTLIDLPKVGETILVPTLAGWRDLVVEGYSKGAVVADGHLWHIDKVLRRVEPKPAETKYRLDPNKPHLDLKKHGHKLKVGDMVFDWVHGPASSGGMYGIGLVVVEITENEIITRGEGGGIDKWNRKDGFSTDPQSAYFIAFFQESTNP